MLIKNARFYDDDFNLSSADIRITGDTVTEIASGLDGDKNIIDATGCVIIPGLIDVHIHGCAGVDTADASVASVSKMSKFLASRGITSFIPTAISDTPENQRLQARAVRKAAAMPGGARVIAFRAEGSFLSSGKPGTHPIPLLRNPDIDEVDALNEAADGMLKIVDIAPELDGAFDFIDKATSKGYILSLAHSGCGYDTAIKAFHAGVTDTTHLYNAMSPLAHREPGVVGAVFDTDTPTFCEIISDGIHVHPAAVRIAAKTVGRDRLVLISDGSPAVGMPDGKYKIGTVDIVVVNGAARNEDGNLAGSTATVMDCLLRITDMGIPFADALRAATINPARLIGADKMLGSIKGGKKADLVMLSADREIKRVIIGGKPFNRGLV